MKDFIHQNIAYLTPLCLGFGGFCTLTNYLNVTEFKEPLVHIILLVGLALATYALGAAKYKIQGISEIVLSPLQLWLAFIAFASLAILVDGLSGKRNFSAYGYLYCLLAIAASALLFFGIVKLRKYIKKRFEPGEIANT